MPKNQEPQVRILYVAFRHDYGFVDRGLSFEHYNFYVSLAQMGHEIEYFDIGSHLASRGREGMNELLRSRVAATSPDLLFSCMVGDELDPDVIRDISEHTDTATFNWFCDDHWRFDTFTARYAPSFNWVSTTAASALPRYAQIGHANVVKTQWAASDSIYRRRGLPALYDLTFVGQVYGDRPAVLRHLQQEGLPVQRWGTGWNVRRWHWAAARLPVVRSLGGRALLETVRASTRADQEQMLSIFEQSKINLNLVASSQGAEPQIKGRTFEVPACGGFLLDGRTEGLEEYLEIDKEVVVYHDIDDMVEKSKFYLRHEQQRLAVAHAGHKRVHAEHTYRRRFEAIFRAMGLSR